MIIRKMEFKDLPEVSRLAHELGYPNTLEELEIRFKAVSQGDGELMVSLSENVITGWIQVNKDVLSLLVDPRAEISALVVGEKYRNQKMGKALVKAAEEWALSNGLNVMRVRSNIKREKAHRFYEREGYEIKKTGYTFEKNLS